MKAKKKYNDDLIVKNNQNNEDEGVRDIILTLEKDNVMNKLKQFRKIPLLAALGFLHKMDLEEAKEKFKDLLVADLINDIWIKYDLESPQSCKECLDVYNIGEALE